MSTLTKNTYYIDNTTIVFPNFRGEGGPMNRDGDRNFNIVIPDQALADTLKADGYNVKVREAREATEEYEARPPLIFLPVKLGFNGRTPPRVVMITCVEPTTCKRTVLTEEAVGLLDTVTITNVDCKIGPYDWTQNGGGRTAYAQSLFVTVELDKYDAKYENIPYSDPTQDPNAGQLPEASNDSYSE